MGLQKEAKATKGQPRIERMNAGSDSMIAVIIGMSIGDDSAGVKEISVEIDGGVEKRGNSRQASSASRPLLAAT